MSEAKIERIKELNAEALGSSEAVPADRAWLTGEIQ